MAGGTFLPFLQQIDHKQQQENKNNINVKAAVIPNPIKPCWAVSKKNVKLLLLVVGKIH